MKQIAVILPVHLFEDPILLSELDKNCTIIIYEHPKYFTDYPYHKLKLVLHRSSMKFYHDYLNKKTHHKIIYLEYAANLAQKMKSFAPTELIMYDPVDFDVVEDFKRIAGTQKIELKILETELFITKTHQLQDYINEGGGFFQTSFYIWQRKIHKILLDSKGKPLGKKWTFDKENRLPFPTNYVEENIFKKKDYGDNKYVNEGVEYIKKHFSKNIGDLDKSLPFLPITHDEAKEYLNIFLKKKLDLFGPYEDAVSKNILFGNHSVLAPIMNIGLLTHQLVINKITEYYQKNPKIKLSSVEGIVRQIIGWANYMRMVYMYKHNELESKNYFNHKKRLGSEWYTATTGIEPIDDIIKKVLTYGYAHHIERLMYLGNFMLLSKISPKDVHDWFMVMFQDSYSWAMVTNVYGMSQYSCGPVLATRPYFSSSNYIHKMSSYKKGNTNYKITLSKKEYEWYDVWDALYYNFINDNQKVLEKNYSTARSVYHWKNKGSLDKKNLLTIAKQYLHKY